MANIYSTAPNRPMPNSHYQTHFFSFVFAQKSLPPLECCLGSPFPGTGHTHKQAISPQTLLRLTGTQPSEGVMAKVHRKPTREQHSNWNCDAEAGTAELPTALKWNNVWLSAAVQTTGDGEVGQGELRQGRWWLLSPPRLADPITEWLNMTELTLPSYSEGRRKISRAKRLQHRV